MDTKACSEFFSSKCHFTAYNITIFPRNLGIAIYFKTLFDVATILEILKVASAEIDMHAVTF